MRQQISLILLMLFAPLFVGIAPVQASPLTESTLTIDQNQTKNFYGAGEEIIFAADASQDVILMGSTVKVDGFVGGNLIVVGGDVVISGHVDGDIFLVAVNSLIDADVTGDIRATVGQLYIDSDRVGGDLAAAAGELTVSSSTILSGRLITATGAQYLNSDAIPTDISSFGKINVEDFAAVGAAFVIVSVVLAILVLAGSYLLDYLIIRVFPVFTERTLKRMQAEPLIDTIVGVSVFIFSPIVGLGLLISGIGLPLLGFLILLGILATTIAKAYATYMIGRYILQKLNRPNTGRALTLLVGFVLIALIDFIPVFGWLLSGLLAVILPAWGIGSMVMNKWKAMKVKQK